MRKNTGGRHAERDSEGGREEALVLAGIPNPVDPPYLQAIVAGLQPCGDRPAIGSQHGSERLGSAELIQHLGNAASGISCRDEERQLSRVRKTRDEATLGNAYAWRRPIDIDRDDRACAHEYLAARRELCLRTSVGRVGWEGPVPDKPRATRVGVGETIESGLCDRQHARDGFFRDHVYGCQRKGGRRWVPMDVCTDHGKRSGDATRKRRRVPRCHEVRSRGSGSGWKRIGAHADGDRLRR